ncbi:hypothetical protein GCM10018980_19490 [Streptomyces capoamus]|uniref:Uncharacterized protein n=1 Tax=Streptomyces capoamus TaxID=68183 RepID=A0A919C580_9ACTN|nr:hypothetical protein GCM10010501_33080 [Streptomyces libani subsp. rufus]GHG42984.1 hypothetical protein GCM10018980_19490 [Streptomyces capoamus]
MPSTRAVLEARQGAAASLEVSGLSTDPTTVAYAQMSWTLAYTAAPGRTARRGLGDGRGSPPRRLPPAAHRLPQNAPAGRLFAISPVAVDLYAVGVHWALGDAGAALDAGENLQPEQFPTAERKARPHRRDTARLTPVRGTDAHPHRGRGRGAPLERLRPAALRPVPARRRVPGWSASATPVTRVCVAGSVAIFGRRSLRSPSWVDRRP